MSAGQTKKVLVDGTVQEVEYSGIQEGQGGAFGDRTLHIFDSLTAKGYELHKVVGNPDFDYMALKVR